MYLLGVDIGYSNLKVAGGAPGNLSLHAIRPAGAGPARELDEAIDGGRVKEGVSVDIDGQPWVAAVEPGRFAHVQREVHEGYASTQTYRALGAAGISYSQQKNIDLLVTGLPAELYRNSLQRQAVKKSLLGTHRFTGWQAHVNKVQVIRQPLGAFVEASVSGGKAYYDILNRGRVAVVDIGFYSFDWTMLEAGAIKGASAGSALAAMSQIIEAIDNQISSDKGVGPGPELIEKALRNGEAQILLCGEWLDVTRYLKRLRSRIAERAISSMRRAYREMPPIDLFILTGGGAEQYRDALTHAYPKTPVYISEHPATANARGFWYIAQQYIQKKSAS